MAYKRRRIGSGPSSRRRPPSQPQSFSHMSSVSRGLQPSSPALSTLSQHKRLSLHSAVSHATTSSSSRSRDTGVFEETDAEIQVREEADALNEIIMAMDIQDKGTIGCAFYVAREEKLSLMADIKMAGFDIVDTLKLHAQPTSEFSR